MGMLGVLKQADKYMFSTCTDSDDKILFLFFAVDLLLRRVGGDFDSIHPLYLYQYISSSYT